MNPIVDLLAGAVVFFLGVAAGLVMCRVNRIAWAREKLRDALEEWRDS